MRARCQGLGVALRLAIRASGRPEGVLRTRLLKILVEPGTVTASNRPARASLGAPVAGTGCVGAPVRATLGAPSKVANNGTRTGCLIGFNLLWSSNVL